MTSNRYVVPGTSCVASNDAVFTLPRTNSARRKRHRSSAFPSRTRNDLGPVEDSQFTKTWPAGRAVPVIATVNGRMNSCVTPSTANTARAVSPDCRPDTSSVCFPPARLPSRPPPLRAGRTSAVANDRTGERESPRRKCAAPPRHHSIVAARRRLVNAPRASVSRVCARHAWQMSDPGLVARFLVAPATGHVLAPEVRPVERTRRIVPAVVEAVVAVAVVAVEDVPVRAGSGEEPVEAILRAERRIVVVAGHARARGASVEPDPPVVGDESVPLDERRAGARQQDAAVAAETAGTAGHVLVARDDLVLDGRGRAVRDRDPVLQDRAGEAEPGDPAVDDRAARAAAVDHDAAQLIAGDRVVLDRGVGGRCDLHSDAVRTGARPGVADVEDLALDRPPRRGSRRRRARRSRGCRTAPVPGPSIVKRLTLTPETPSTWTSAFGFARAIDDGRLDVRRVGRSSTTTSSPVSSSPLARAGFGIIIAARGRCPGRRGSSSPSRSRGRPPVGSWGRPSAGLPRTGSVRRARRRGPLPGEPARTGRGVSALVLVFRFCRGAGGHSLALLRYQAPVELSLAVVLPAAGPLVAKPRFEMKWLLPTSRSPGPPVSAAAKNPAFVFAVAVFALHRRALGPVRRAQSRSRVEREEGVAVHPRA